MLDIIPQTVENNQLKDIVAQVKKDVENYNSIVNYNFEDYKKSSFGIKIKKLF